MVNLYTYKSLCVNIQDYPYKFPISVWDLSCQINYDFVEEFISPFNLIFNTW